MGGKGPTIGRIAFVRYRQRKVLDPVRMGQINEKEQNRSGGSQNRKGGIKEVKRTEETRVEA